MEQKLSKLLTAQPEDFRPGGRFVHLLPFDHRFRDEGLFDEARRASALASGLPTLDALKLEPGEEIRAHKDAAASPTSSAAEVRPGESDQ